MICQSSQPAALLWMLHKATVRWWSRSTQLAAPTQTRVIINNVMFCQCSSVHNQSSWSSLQKSLSRFPMHASIRLCIYLFNFNLLWGIKEMKYRNRLYSQHGPKLKVRRVTSCIELTFKHRRKCLCWNIIVCLVKSVSVSLVAILKQL